MIKISDLPDELQIHIYKFTYDKCDKCKSYKHFTQITRKCRIFEYKSVFHSDYWFNNYEHFNLICHDCIETYRGKIMINLNTNTYSWIE